MFSFSGDLQNDPSLKNVKMVLQVEKKFFYCYFALNLSVFFSPCCILINNSSFAYYSIASWKSVRSHDFFPSGVKLFLLLPQNSKFHSSWLIITVKCTEVTFRNDFPQIKLLIHWSS